MSNANRWTPYKLDQLGTVSRGRSRHRPRNEPSLYGGPYPFFQTGDIKAAELYLRNFEQTYSEKGLAQSKLWEPGTVCITIAANIAETAILALRGCFPDSVVGFVADQSKSDPCFIKYYIDLIKLSMQNVSRGTTQDNLSVDKLLSFDFLAPPLPTQRKIASILSAYDDLIENNTRRIAILEEMAQAIYREWFVNFRFPGHENVKLVDSPLGMIPEGWEATTVGELCTKVRAGGTPKRKQDNYWAGGTIDWYKTKELWDGYLFESEEKITELASKESTTRMFDPDTILMAIYGSPTVGRMGILTQRSACNQAALAMVPDPSKASIPFLFHVLLSLRDHFNTIAMGAAQQNISKAKVINASCVLPPHSLVEQFDDVCGPLFNLVKNISLKNRNLRTTRDLLLPKLISGKLDVEDLDIDIAALAAEGGEDG